MRVQASTWTSCPPIVIVTIECRKEKRPQKYVGPFLGDMVHKEPWMCSQPLAFVRMQGMLDPLARFLSEVVCRDVVQKK